MNKLKILILIPCYNEEQNIFNLVNEIRNIQSSLSIPFDFLIINDSSNDNTLAIVKSLNCKFLNLPVNLGIGGAMQTGFKYAFENGYNFAVQMDGDGQHPPKELHKLLNIAIEKSFDIVIGSRFINKEGFQSSFLRRLGINYFKWLNYFLIGKLIHDSTSGFRVLNRKALDLVCKYYPDEYPEPESIVFFGLNKLTIKEVSVQMLERQGGVSSINAFKSIYYMFKVSLGTIFVYLRYKGKWKM